MTLYFNEKNYLATDEAIYRHLVSLKETNLEFCFLLDKWHAKKNIYIILISIFLRYEIFNLALILGVCYFNKFEQLVNY